MAQLESPRIRLAQLVERAARARGLRGLSDAELLEFGRLYRRTVAELAHARSYGLDSAELEHLNWLVSRAYALLYVTESHGWSGFGRFFTQELPRMLRRQGRLIALATALFLIPALFGGLLTLFRPAAAEVLFPELTAQIQHMAQRHAGNPDWVKESERPGMSSFVMTNNLQVSFLAFAGGMLLGLPAVLVLVQNGLMLGVLGAGVSRTPSSIYFWSFVAPHGVLEIPTILIAAAAGLRLGFALLEPGRYSRADALRLAGRDSAVLMLGVICFLAIAGTIEGLFSPAVLPPTLKFAVAGAVALALICYWALAGREAPQRP